VEESGPRDPPSIHPPALTNKQQLPLPSPLPPSSKKKQQYHPDKNPDPAAATYFAEYITKAYKALTDEAARENYEKHGHPDGPQGMRMNIALPEWMFVSDGSAAPVVLAVLVFGCILAPLAGAAAYILSAAKKRSASGVAPETTELFVRSKWAVKERMALHGVQDTLVMAYEFIMMPTPKSQEEALQALARTLMKGFPDLKEGHPFWKRRPSIVKVHMLLMAHCGREPVPPALTADLETVLRRCPTFLEEMLKIGNIPRVQGWPYGWLAPTVGCIEMMQCLNQAVPFFVKKPSIGASRTSLKASDIPLAILPHMVTGPDMEPVKRLARAKQPGPLRTPADLARLADDELAAVLTGVAGLTPAAAADVFACLQAMPNLALSPAVVGIQSGDDGDELEGVDGSAPEASLPRPGDILTASVRVLLRRRSHRTPGARPPSKPVVAFTPYLPPALTRRERWWVVVGDLASNTCFAIAPVDLRAAEAAAFDVPKQEGGGSGGSSPAASGSSAAAGKGRARPSTPSPEDEAALASEWGAQVDVRFEAPKADKYNLTVMLVTDAWVGCDRSVPARLRVVEASRAELEGRARRGGGKGGGGCCGGAHAAAPAAAAAAAATAKAPTDDIQPASDAGSGDDDDESEEEWDSEESGTEESGSDAERDVAAARAGTRTLVAGGGGGGGGGKGRAGSAQAKADGTAAAQAAAAGGEIGSADDSSASSSSDEDDSSEPATTTTTGSSSPSAGGGTTTTSSEEEESSEAATSTSPSGDGSGATATTTPSSSADGSPSSSSDGGAAPASAGKKAAPAQAATPSGDGAVEDATDEE
jgi:translocation protein SEC63